MLDLLAPVLVSLRGDAGAGAFRRSDGPRGLDRLHLMNLLAITARLAWAAPDTAKLRNEGRITALRARAALRHLIRKIPIDLHRSTRTGRTCHLQFANQTQASPLYAHGPHP